MVGHIRGRRGPAAAPLGSALALALVLFGPFATASPAEPFTPEFRTLGLGQTADELPLDDYEAFACGQDGAPPLRPIGGWTDFMACDPDENGLREVYAEFGGRIGQVSEMFRDQYEDELWIQKFGGTRMANHPVVLSLLFDETGVVRLFRVVTDARAPLEDRGRAYLFRYPVMSSYGEQNWDCVAREPGPRETGVGRMYLNEVCTKTIGGKEVRVEAHFFRKAGQTGTDAEGQFLPGQFESLTRWEVFDADWFEQE